MSWCKMPLNDSHQHQSGGALLCSCPQRSTLQRQSHAESPCSHFKLLARGRSLKEQVDWLGCCCCWAWMGVIAWVAVEDGQLGQAWHQDFATQDVRHLSCNYFSSTLVRGLGVRALSLDNRTPSHGLAICAARAQLLPNGPQVLWSGIIPTAAKSPVRPARCSVLAAWRARCHSTRCLGNNFPASWALFNSILND